MNLKLEVYWNDIPCGKENACTYPELCRIWNCDERKARLIMHELSCYDDGSDFVLIRSARGKGFYKTDNMTEIKAYRNEILSKGKSIFAPLRKINRIISAEPTQYNIANNMRLIRTDAGLTMADVVERMKKYDSSFDKPMLSKMENNVCLPTYFQLCKLSEIYKCSPEGIVNINLM